ncbi:MAG: hypothetical protein ACFFDW_08185 [Candidatus Thorarchaeota archaeon]
MTKKSLVAFIFIALLLNLTILINISSKTENNQQITFETDVISDFSDFYKLEDSPYISSTASSSNIQISADYSSISESVWEKYELLLDTGVSVADFNLEVEFSYSYSGSMFKGIYIEAGSLHNENGDVVAANAICTASIWDPWSETSGVYAVRAFGNVDERLTGGTIARDDELLVRIIRTDSELNIYIIKNNVVKKSGTWNTADGLTRDLDYINLSLNINPYYTQDTSVVFSSFNLLLNSYFSNPYSNSGSPSNSGTIIGIAVGCTILFVGIIGGIIFLSIKKRKPSTRISPTIAQQSKQLLSYESKKSDTLQLEELPKIESDSAVYSWQLEEKEQ